MELHPRPESAGDSGALALLSQSPQERRPTFGHEEIPLLHYFQVIRKRAWWVVATLVVVFTLSLISTLRAPRLYQATSKIAVSPETPGALGFRGVDDNFAG